MFFFSTPLFEICHLWLCSKCMHCLLYTDDIKTMYAESSLDMHLLKIISLLSSKTDEESQGLVKGASELLVLVLTAGK